MFSYLENAKAGMADMLHVSYSQLCNISLNVQLSRHAQKHKITLFSFHELLN